MSSKPDRLLPAPASDCVELSNKLLEVDRHFYSTKPVSFEQEV